MEIVAGKIAEQLAERGWQITWVASETRRPDGTPVPHSESTATVAGSAIKRVSMRSWNFTEDRLGFPYPIWGPISLVKLYAQVLQSDVVHLHDSLYFGNIVAYICARLSRKPVVITQHTGPTYFKNRVLRFINQLAIRTFGRSLLGGCSGSVFISSKVQRYFSRLISFKCNPVFVPNGVNHHIFHPVGDRQRGLRTRLNWPSDKFVTLFVGRFVPVKNLALLRKLAGHFPEINWVFIGWGPDNPMSWGLANVYCYGQVDHQLLPAYYQAADLLVLPSVGEGFPLVVQEAMACGLPVVISEDTALGSPGIQDAALVSDLEWGRLVSFVEELMSDHGRLRLYGKAALDYAGYHWSSTTWIDRYEYLFADLGRPTVNMT